MIPASCILWGCQKNGSAAPDASLVSFRISSPADGQVFHPGDTASINGLVLYNGVMHGYEVKVTDSASGFILFDHAEHIHQDSFNIQEQMPMTGNTSMVLKLKLTAEIDHNGTDATKTLTLLYEP